MQFVWGLSGVRHIYVGYPCLWAWLMLSVVSALPRGYGICLLLQVHELQSSQVSQATRPNPCCQAEKQKSRLAILALSLFRSGRAHTEKWLLSSTCPQPRGVGHGGRRRAEACSQLPQWHAGGLVWHPQRQLVVWPDVGLPCKHKGFGHQSADRNCFVSPCCRKAWSNNAVIVQADLVHCWQLPGLILGLEKLSWSELIQVNSFISFWLLVKTISDLSLII